MIILGNSDFAIGMRLAGIKESFVVEDREKGKHLVKRIPPNEIVVANTSVVKLLPELHEFKNLVTIPDKPEEFSSVEDLKYIVKSAIGFECEV